MDHPAAIGHRRASVPPARAAGGGTGPDRAGPAFAFDLAWPDTVDLRLVPDFPCSARKPSSGPGGIGWRSG